ncbi:hypothetical protein VTP01DRAFT_5504 [Rhizomucor pusillus]|uniref:uncharacterized protein n=1 Tax=Rhizomucor pusillus TaxID=4840 RepID=UPI0037434BA5
MNSIDSVLRRPMQDRHPEATEPGTLVADTYTLHIVYYSISNIMEYIKDTGNDRGQGTRTKNDSRDNGIDRENDADIHQLESANAAGTHTEASSARDKDKSLHHQEKK